MGILKVQKEQMAFTDKELSEINIMINDIKREFDYHIQNNLWRDFNTYNSVTLVVGGDSPIYKTISFNKLRHSENILIITNMIVERFKTCGWVIKNDGRRYDVIDFINKLPKDIVHSVQLRFEYKLRKETLIDKIKKLIRWK